MNINFLENNYLTLVGTVTGEKQLSHEIYGEKFYTFKITIPRLSGQSDVIPITASERLIEDNIIAEGNKLLVRGQFRSYNTYDAYKNRLILTVFAKEIVKVDSTELDVENELVTKDLVTNEVTLVGYICKKPVYRQTPFGREISDLLVAVNRAYNKSDYIPCIAWGKIAKFCGRLKVGTELKLIGRVQSREYEKKYEDGTVENRVAYEVSIGCLEVLNSEDDDEKNEETRITDETEQKTENQEAV